jgi:hypothetical protein
MPPSPTSSIGDEPSLPTTEDPTPIESRFASPRSDTVAFTSGPPELETTPARLLVKLLREARERRTRGEQEAS